MESVKAPFSTSVEMFTVFTESLCSGLETNSESDVYGGRYLATSASELNPYQSTFPYDYTSTYPRYPSSDKTSTCDNLSWTERFSPDDYSPLSTPDIGIFPPSLGSQMSPVSSFTDTSRDASPSSPLQPNEYFNVFDFDFSTSVPNKLFPSSEPPSRQPSPLPSSSPRKSSHVTTSRSPRNREVFDLVSQRSPSPSTNDSGQKRRFPCLILGCARRFTSQYTLKVHMQAHKPKPRVSFPCTQGCSERFSRQHDRLRHEVAKHGRICEFLCDDCGRFFSSKKTLGNHKCPLAQGGTRWVVI